MPRLQIPADVLAAEPWLAALAMPADTSIDDVRARAARASAGEVIRRQHAGEERLYVRHRDGGRITTALDIAAPVVAENAKNATTRDARP
ncbi:hypothetical protein [Cellulomonas xylanilytica]|uniref:Uncharacterized protein n=1 Tax=Cellulomonas xylanilytica TaxID=233583 RepID=A0A510V772_9CELL|nr:hypothetical protein [Cellulomonas xylanilytica]GEK20995.1 hypothetical protein CXY01_15150 [Cellulomonas xylanilytica]